MKPQRVVAGLSIDWPNFFSTDQSKPMGNVGPSVLKLISQLTTQEYFFGQVTEGFCGVSFVSCFGLFVWASFWFTELVIHSVFVLALS